ILYQSWTKDAPVLVPSIITATVESIAAKKAQSVAVFGSQSIYWHDAYGKALASAGVREVKLTEPEQAIVVAAIEEVKKLSVTSAATRAQVETLLLQLKARGA